MFSGFPTDTKITIFTTDNTSCQFNFDAPQHNVPVEVSTWLNELGWGSPCTHPDTGEQLYQKAGHAGSIGISYFTWSEAVAWEWYMMMSLGGNDK